MKFNKNAMNKISLKMLRSFACAIFLTLGLSACVSTIVGTAVDTTIEVAKVPFKIVGAVFDVVTGNDD